MHIAYENTPHCKKKTIFLMNHTDDFHNTSHAHTHSLLHKIDKNTLHPYVFFKKFLLFGIVCTVSINH